MGHESIVEDRRLPTVYTLGRVNPLDGAILGGLAGAIAGEIAKTRDSIEQIDRGAGEFVTRAEFDRLIEHYNAFVHRSNEADATTVGLLERQAVIVEQFEVILNTLGEMTEVLSEEHQAIADFQDQARNAIDWLQYEVATLAVTLSRNIDLFNEPPGDDVAGNAYARVREIVEAARQR